LDQKIDIDRNLLLHNLNNNNLHYIFLEFSIRIDSVLNLMVMIQKEHIHQIKLKNLYLVILIMEKNLFKLINLYHLRQLYKKEVI